MYDIERYKITGRYHARSDWTIELQNLFPFESYRYRDTYTNVQFVALRQSGKRVFPPCIKWVFHALQRETLPLAWL